MGPLTTWAGATYFEHIGEYLRIHRPRAVILENVAGLMGRAFADTYAAMLDSLRGIKGKTGRSYDAVSTRLVDTAAWGDSTQQAKARYCLHGI